MWVRLRTVRLEDDDEEEKDEEGEFGEEGGEWERQIEGVGDPGYAIASND